MTTLLRWSRAVVLFVAVAGFLFGQVFNGEFSVGGTLGGVGGALAAGAALPSTARAISRNAALLGCALGLLGAGLHAYDYYSVPQPSGNYYAWFLTLPFCLGLLVIAYAATRKAPAEP